MGGQAAEEMKSVPDATPRAQVITAGLVGGRRGGSSRMVGPASLLDPVRTAIGEIFDPDDADRIYRAVKSGAQFFLTTDEKSHSGQSVIGATSCHRRVWGDEVCVNRRPPHRNRSDMISGAQSSVQGLARRATRKVYEWHCETRLGRMSSILRLRLRQRHRNDSRTDQPRGGSRTGPADLIDWRAGLLDRSGQFRQALNSRTRSVVDLGRMKRKKAQMPPWPTCVNSSQMIITAFTRAVPLRNSRT